MNLHFFKIKKFIPIIIISFLITSCSTSFGEKLEYEKLEVYYTKDIGISYAQAILDYFIANDLITGKKQSIQVTSDSKSLILKMVNTKKESEETKRNIKGLEQDIQESVFNDRKIKIQVCDAFFNPKKD